MIDIRYHSITIVAIFMMLGVGILIGERFAAPAQTKQQAKLLALLKSQVDGAVQDGRESNRRLSHIEHAVDVLRMRVVPGKLAGKHVEIILCGDYTTAADAATNAVMDAGATSVARITITDRLVELDPDSRASLMQNMMNNGDPPSTQPALGNVSQTDLLRPVMSVLHSGTDASADDQMLSTLATDRYITVTGDDSQPCSLFVLVGGRNDDGIPPAQNVADTESAIIEGLKEGGADVNVVGCEPDDAAVSSVPNYQQEKIATVDCIDQPLGQLDLPFALRGGVDKDGDYGLKSTATLELPVSLQEQNHP